MQNGNHDNTVGLTTKELVDISLHLALYRARCEMAGVDVSGLRQLEQRVRSFSGWATNPAVKAVAA